MSTRRFLEILSDYRPELPLSLSLDAATAALVYADERVEVSTDDYRHEVLTLQNEVAALTDERDAARNRPAQVPHEVLVKIVQSNFDNMRDNALNGKKIQAIKSLRGFALCGLKEAKEAVEDSRVFGGF